MTLRATVVAGALSCVLSVMPATADDDVMVVFDASGSMYGNVGSETKLEAAKRALRKVVGRWDEMGVKAGLVAYGHRRRRDCNDIETLITPGPIDGPAFQSTIDRIQANGSTPLTEAVRRAAEELDYTRQKATVILMSDGKETCDVDPCALARTLNRTGASFKAHVIALAVKPEDEDGLRCLAEETGGRYIQAANADQLTDAFFNLSARRSFNFTVTTADGSDRIGEPVEWTISNDVTRIRRVTEDGELVLRELTSGNYRLTARVGDRSAEQDILISDTGRRSFDLRLLQDLTSVRIEGPKSIRVGERFSVNWFGPNDRGDKVQISRRGAVPGVRYSQSYDLQDYEIDDNGTLLFIAPREEGEYELRYYSGPQQRLLVRERIVVEPADELAEIERVLPVKAGYAFDVGFRGPEGLGDVIAIAKPEADVSDRIQSVKVRQGNPLSLRAPSTAGDYEIRYIDERGARILARRELVVEPTKVEVMAVRATEAGRSFEVSWVGPGHADDWVALIRPGTQSGDYIERSMVHRGTILDLQAPAQNGEYELVYVNGLDGTISARRNIVVR